jgi:hypothetical protein
MGVEVATIEVGVVDEVVLLETVSVVDEEVMGTD